LIVTENLTKDYREVRAVDGLNLSIKPGEWVIFVGPNGAGKSTTMKMLAGLLEPTRGRATVAGMDVARRPLRVKRAIGYLSEEFRPYPYLTGREYLDFVAEVHQVPREEREGRIADLLNLFDIAEPADRLIHSYSQGMTKMLGLCGALVHLPPVLLLDEPTAGLDPERSYLVRKVIRGLCDEGTTVLMTTHILGVTETLCERICIINQGRGIRDCSLLELYAEYPGQTLEEICLRLTRSGSDDVIERYLESRRKRGGPVWAS